MGTETVIKTTVYCAFTKKKDVETAKQKFAECLGPLRQIKSNALQ